MDDGTKFLIQLLLGVLTTVLTVLLVDRVKAKAEQKRAESDAKRADGDNNKTMGEAAAILADTSADLGKSWQEYAQRFQVEFAAYKQHAEQKLAESERKIAALQAELEDHRRKSGEDTANQNAVILDLTAQVATLRRENTDLRGRIVELKTENAELKRNLPKRVLGSK